MEDDYSFTLVNFLFSSDSLQSQRKTTEKKILIETGFRVFKRFFYMLSAFYLQLQRRTWSFMVEKMFIEIRLCYLMTNVFKGHVKIVETNMVKINISFK